MILIELETGSQQLFRSQAELDAAIRRGELGPGSRIYHRMSAQWLPVTAYPGFRRNVAKQAPASLPPLARTQWTFFTAESAESSDRQGGSASAAEPVTGRDSPATPGVTEGQSSPALRRTLGRAIKYIRSMGNL